MHVHLYEILSHMKQGAPPKKREEKRKRKKSFPEKEGGYLRHQFLKFFLFP